MDNLLRAVLCALLAVAGIAAAAPDAKAAPPAVPWSGQAAGDAARVDLNLPGDPALAGVRLANGESTASSTSTPRVSSVTRNVASAHPGLGIAPQANDQTAPPDNAAAETGFLLGANASGIGLGILTFSNEAHWAGDGNCVPGVLADTTTGTAGLSLGPGTTSILATGAASTSGLVRLVSFGGTGLNRGVQSRAVGTLSGASLLGGAVTVHLAGEATLTATAGGTPGGAFVIYDAPVVAVTRGTAPATTVNPGDSLTVDLGDAGRVVLRVNKPTLVADPAGFGAEASVAVVSVEARRGPAAAPLGTVSVDLLPLTVSAAVAAGGIDCPPPAPTVDTPADGAVLGDTTPTFSGTGTPGATVQVIIDGATAGGGPINGNGDWTYTPIAPLADGPHTVSAIQSLKGVTSPESAENAFTVSDSQPPAAPVITAPDNGSTTNDNTPTVTGTGEPGATVTVRTNGNVIGTATVNGSGNWQLPPPTQQVADGRHTLAATQTDQAENTSEVAEARFTIDTAALPPVIVKPKEGSRADATPVVAGTGEARATVTVRVDGAVVGTAPVRGDGNWDLALTTRLADGEHKVTATQTDEAGNTSPPDEVGFAVDTRALPPAITEPEDGSTANDNTPTIAGTAEPGSRVILFVDGRPIGSITADAEGNWRLSLDGKLPDGEHEISAIAVDPAGNESAVKAITLTVDTSDDGSGPVLARTGGPRLTVAVLAALLLAGGAALIPMGRRHARSRMLGR